MRCLERYPDWQERSVKRALERYAEWRGWSVDQAVAQGRMWEITDLWDGKAESVLCEEVWAVTAWEAWAQTAGRRGVGFNQVNCEVVQ